MKQYINPEITVVEFEAESVLQSISADPSEVNDKNRAPRYNHFYDEDDENII